MARSVLHVAETTIGGVGVFIRDLALRQIADGDRVNVAVPPGGPVVEELELAGASTHHWDAVPQPGPRVPGEIVALRSIVRRVDPQIVHLHSSKAGLVGRLLLRRSRPTVMQPHSWSFFARTGRVRDVTLRWERVAARWTDVVLCVSEDERRLGIEEGIRAEYRVLPNGVDLSRFAAPAEGDRAPARTRLGLGDEPLAVCVGRLHRQKNQGALLGIWRRVRDAVPGARLALVGDGPDREELDARSVEGVDFVGQTDDVRSWLAAANVVVQPSLWEGMSLSLLEAMAAARGVVVTDVPGMREVVVDGSGAVVPLGDADALTGAVVERLRDADRADAEGARGRKLVEKEHDQRTQFDGISKLYDELTAR